MPIRIIDKTLSLLNDLDEQSRLKITNYLTRMEVEIETEQSSNKNRINGYDDALCGDYQHLFSQLRNSYGNKAAFCPGNSFHCATALAVEWISCGGNIVVTAFGGIGGCAATEEVIMALRLKGLRNATTNYDFLPEMTDLFYKIMGQTEAESFEITNKPIIGEDIFHVESGVHVDGILKHPECYEPFPPEVVGLKRKIILGKQSGSASIKYKLEKLNIKCGQELIPLILEQVKLKAIKLNRAITDIEFLDIVEECTL